MSEIFVIWECIEVWYVVNDQMENLNLGVIVEVFVQVEKDMGLIFLFEMCELLLCYDGSVDDSWFIGELFLLECMVDECKVWMDLFQDGMFDGNVSYNESLEVL